MDRAGPSWLRKDGRSVIVGLGRRGARQTGVWAVSVGE